MYDVIIIGAGIAGLTSALYSARGDMKTLILESNAYGGQIINSNEVENYPGFESISGYQLSKNILEQVKKFNVEIKYESVTTIEDKNTIVTNKNTYKTKTIIIATGLKKRQLGLYGENDLIGKGISYCATCDGNFYKDKIVAIVGGGNTAIEDALYLSNIVKKLYVIHRKNSFRADSYLIEQLSKKDNVDYILESEIISLNGEDKLEAITVRSNEEDLKIEIDGLFIAIGQIPDNLKFSNLIQIDEYGFICSNDCTTNVDNIFVAGDCRTKELRQLITAASDGAIAATKCINYVNEIDKDN